MSGNKAVFCTLFDSVFLMKGLALYSSLSRHCDNFILYVFAFDDLAYRVLSDAALPSLHVISLSQFEDQDLMSVKESRSKREYCWTSTPSTIKFVLDRYGHDHCIYLDSDVFFFSNPEPMLEEFRDPSILITGHRYSPAYDNSGSSGKYCVQFTGFKNNIEGRKALEWWRNACIDWCYARHEDGKFGDQKYLDDWPVRFAGTHVLTHPGGGVAPWNIQQFRLSGEDEKILIRDYSGQKSELIFYHFHELVFLNNNKVDLSGYRLPGNCVKLIYIPYLDAIREWSRFLSNKYPGTNFMASHEPDLTFKTIYTNARRMIKRTYNIIRHP